MRLTDAELAATIDKIDKINARAVARGFTGRLTVTHERVTVTSVNPVGFTVEEIVNDVTIDGTPPSYNGWTFIATLARDGEAGLIVRTAPGVDKVDRTGLREGWCDHCKLDRDRKETYLVRNADGRQCQVGSTCIKDFLGWAGRPVFLSAADVQAEVDTFLGACEYAERRWSVDTILAVAWACVQAFGWSPANSDRPTKYTVLDVLDPHSDNARALARDLAPYVDQAAGQAAVIRGWLLSEEFTGDNDYVINLKAVAGAPSASPRNVGLLVSAPQTWARAQERELRRKQEAETLVNEFYGPLGAKIEVDVTVKSIRFVDNGYGTTTIYTMVSPDGYVFKWFASRSALGTETDGTVYRIKGTIDKVKGHDEWQGRKSTRVTRAKVLTPTSPTSA